MTSEFPTLAIVSISEMVTGDHAISSTDRPIDKSTQYWLEQFNNHYAKVEKWINLEYPMPNNRRYPPDQEGDLSLEAALNRLGVSPESWDAISKGLTPAEKIQYGTLFLVARKCRISSDDGQNIEAWRIEDWLVLYEARHRIIDELIK